jgi:hypothetical protein
MPFFADGDLRGDPRNGRMEGGRDGKGRMFFLASVSFLASGGACGRGGDGWMDEGGRN